jgi:hypothetical protein
MAVAAKAAGPMAAFRHNANHNKAEAVAASREFWAADVAAAAVM